MDPKKADYAVFTGVQVGAAGDALMGTFASGLGFLKRCHALAPICWMISSISMVCSLPPERAFALGPV